MNFLLNPLSFSDEEQRRTENIAALLAAESGQAADVIIEVPRLSSHHETMNFIFKAQSLCQLDQSICYLAINYVYRYLSIQGSNHQELKPWAAALLAAACVSLASKMTMASQSAAKTQIDERFQFTAKTLSRMEFIVSDALQWKLRSITPFAFLHYFLSLSSTEDLKFAGDIMARASKAIFEAQTVMKFMDYKPSIVGAAALMTANKGVAFCAAIRDCGFLNNEKLLECCSAMEKEVSCSTDTLRTVLNCRFSEDERTVGSSVDEQDLKKR